MKRIVTEHVYPPIPDRRWDWCATTTARRRTCGGMDGALHGSRRWRICGRCAMSKMREAYMAYLAGGSYGDVDWDDWQAAWTAAAKECAADGIPQKVWRMLLERDLLNGVDEDVQDEIQQELSQICAAACERIGRGEDA